MPLISAPKKQTTESKLLKSKDKKGFLLFMSEINRIKNVEGFISRALQMNFRTKYPALEKLFKEIKGCKEGTHQSKYQKYLSTREKYLNLIHCP